MKNKISGLILAAAVFWSGAVFAEETTASSHIKSVTVYSDRALVTREAIIDVPEGSSVAVIDNLPATIIPSSLRAEGEANSKVILGAVDHRMVAGTELAAPRERDITTRLQDLQDKKALVEADIKANKARQDFIASLGHLSADQTNDDIQQGALKPETWSAASNEIFSEMSQSLKIGVAQAAELRGVDKQIAALQADLNGVRTGQHDRVRVAIPLSSPAATKLTLEISYQLPQAGWHPVYDARLDTGTGKLSITEFGEIHQTTGEDWDDVTLTLSTAQPSVGASPAPVNTRWVDIILPQSGLGVVDQSTGTGVRKSYSNRFNQGDEPEEMNAAQSMAKAASAPAMPAPVAAVYRSASIDTGGFVTEYKIAGSETVMADNSARRVMIGNVDSDSRVLAQARPAEDTNAYLMARTTIKGDSPLLPGPVNLFRDGTFIGGMNLPLVRPGEETTLGFGRDEQIVVKRQVLSDVKGASGLLSKQSTREQKVVSSIHNLHKHAIAIEVLEALPVARNEKVKVDILSDDTTPGYEKDADHTTGLALWKLDLAPNASQDVKLGWRVSWPEDASIQGLP